METIEDRRRRLCFPWFPALNLEMTEIVWLQPRKIQRVCVCVCVCVCVRVRLRAWAVVHVRASHHVMSS